MPMKTSNLATRIAMFVLLAGVLVYFGIYIYRSCTGGLTTVLAYEETVDIGVPVQGLVVRAERILTAPSASAAAEISPSEGEKVAAGDTVALLYTSPAGPETKQAIQTLEAELEQLQYAQRSAAGASASDAAKTEGELVNAMANLHACASTGALTDLEKDALELRTLVFKREFAYGGEGASQGLDGLIDQKSRQLSALRASLGAVTTVVRAPESGVFSAVADGYEDLISPEMLDKLSPSQLTRLDMQPASAPSNAIGKLVTSSTWYFAANASAGSAGNLREGGRYTVSFTRDFSKQISMTLERISDSENGQVLLVFSCRTALSDITLLRHQTAHVVTQELTGLRVPSSALRLVQQTEKRKVTDAATGETAVVEEQVAVTGVYTVPSRRAEFTPVEVLYQGEDYFLVVPVNPEAADRLRAGDEVIVYTAGITDGKVVR